MGFSRQEYWSGLPGPPPGDLLDQGTKPASLMSPALTSRFFTISTMLIMGRGNTGTLHNWKGKVSGWPTAGQWWPVRRILGKENIGLENSFFFCFSWRLMGNLQFSSIGTWSHLPTPSSSQGPRDFPKSFTTELVPKGQREICPFLPSVIHSGSFSHYLPSSSNLAPGASLILNDRTRWKSEREELSAEVRVRCFGDISLSSRDEADFPKSVIIRWTKTFQEFITLIRHSRWEILFWDLGWAGSSLVKAEMHRYHTEKVADNINSVEKWKFSYARKPAWVEKVVLLWGRVMM